MPLPLNSSLLPVTGHTTLIYCQEISCKATSTAEFPFLQKPRGHVVIILELARGMHLLFSLYAFSHIVPLYHLPSGSGCLTSHCPDKARDARPPAEDRSRAERLGAGSGTGAGAGVDARAGQSRGAGQPTAAAPCPSTTPAVTGAAASSLGHGTALPPASC